LRLFGIDHAEVGGILGEHWNLPPTVVDAIRLHHTPERAGDDPRLVHITAVANYLTYNAGIGELSNGCPPGRPDVSIKYLGLSDERCAKVVDHLEASGEKFEEFIGALKG